MSEREKDEGVEPMPEMDLQDAPPSHEEPDREPESHEAETAAAEEAPEEEVVGETPAEPVGEESAPEAIEGEARTDLALQVEALLLTNERALSSTKIAEALEIGLDEGGARAVDVAVARLNAFYDDTGRSFRIERVAGGYRMMTRPEFGRTIATLKRRQASSRLSQAALETLAIVAYRQPITRAEIEAIRGVACGEVLRSLLERRFIKITGRAEEVGRPMLYGTTREFLEAFGLASLKDLPDAKELQSM